MPEPAGRPARNRAGKRPSNQTEGPKGPRQIATVITQLMARRGYNQLLLNEERESLWKNIAGNRIALQTRPGNVNRGVWEILAKNSVVVQELTFCKAALVKKLRELAPDESIRDLRFRVGVIESET